MDKTQDFFALVFRMRYITRWGLMRNSETENVAEHSHDVAVLAHALAVIARDVFGEDCDPERSAALAMLHDASEIFTGDLPTPIKYHNEALTRSYKEVELLAGERLLSYLPEAMRPAYAALLNPDETSPEYRLVKAADKLSAYIKCVEELKAGNGEFEPAARQTRTAMEQMQRPELDWFLEHCLDSFGLTLDELEGN